MTTTPQQHGQVQPGYPPPGYGYPPPRPTGPKFGGLAWTALILGVVGLVGSPIIIFNNLTAVFAGVGVVLGVIALFGTRKVLAGAGVALCVAAISFTVLAQEAAVEELGRELDEIAGGASAGTSANIDDVTISECAVVDDGYGYTSTQTRIEITNSTDTTQSYLVTISVNDETGARVGEINTVSNSLAAGQSTTLAGMSASGTATEDAQPGPANCTVASVERFPS
ncbi:MAG: hypothetical protein ACRDTC_27185 [Pseudonocardiaceae bacterium]